MLQVDLQDKFTSVHFEKVLSKYWKGSFEESRIEFNLSKLEWIAIEQITFLISWINELASLNKNVSILLPSSKDIRTTEPVFRRRQNCVNYLLIDWKLQGLIAPNVQVISGDISATRIAKRNIPYHKVETIPYDATSFDIDFFELYETSFSGFVNYIEKEIKENTLLNYFDNHFLHYSIIKEFYSNTCQHAFKESKNKKCFFSLHTNNKIDEKKFFGKLLKQKIEERYLERPTEEQSFFKNNKGEYINTSFIEFNFLDFGEGIVNTLREKYTKENIELLKDKLSPKHIEQNEDSRVLEYAFLLFTSKYELGKDFEMHDYIPRGLYIIKDIVKRYGGMIIARSGRGKVIFNCKTSNLIDEVMFRTNDADKSIGNGFQGTSITLILPAKSKEKSRNYKRKVQDVSKTLPTSHIINLLRYTNEIGLTPIVVNQTNEVEKRIKFFEEFFRTICFDLLNYKSPNGDIVLFDFAGVERSSQDIFNKFIYFLAYCPLISDKINVCLFNVLDKGINQALLVGDDEMKKSKGFFIKPIPCIYPDMSVNWIGITESDLENRVIEVWKGNESKNETFSDIHHLSGNILKIIFEENGRTEFSIQVQSYFSIIELIYNHHQSFIKNELTDNGIEFKELKNEEHNYNVVLYSKFDKATGKQRAFLTSNGKYQKEFLTFIEKLYIRDYRRLISTYFLFNFCFDNSDGERSKAIRATTKILTVTLSSQLLGKEFTELMNELSVSKSKIVLIPLSNYYDFNTEEPFSEIQECDKIIVVNDVISTGNLSRKIYKSVAERKASIISMITIIDSRTLEDKKAEIFPKITALFERPVEKYSENPFDSSPIWISPILNAPTTMSREKSNRESILKTPQEFINYFKDDSLFKVGYFQQNTRHLSYYLQTDAFFMEEQQNGFPVTSQIIETLKDRLAIEKILSLDADIKKLKNIHATYESHYNLNNLKGNIPHVKHKSILKSFKEIEKVLSSQLADRQQYSIDEHSINQFIDFIFYPFLSSVSEIEKNLKPISLSLRGNHSIEIFPLPRIMTPRGWRFSFPPKFLNFHTKDKSALILDDGSCTGETIIQMIDSLSFLELSEIFVLSIFGRLEDFQREFLSRIKQVRVKDKKYSYKEIPVSIYFGTHFHIPIYTKNTHPLNAELNEMKEIENLYIGNQNEIPSHIQNYIAKRRIEISKPVNPHYSNQQFSLIPQRVPKRLMFVIRDLVGNFDSYRLFKEDEIDFNEKSQSRQILGSLKDILQESIGRDSLIAVLLEEPHLTNTVKRIYPEIISDTKEPNNLKGYINTRLMAIDTSSNVSEFHFYLAGLMQIDFDCFFDLRFVTELMNKIESYNSDAYYLYNLIGYFYSTLIFKTKQNVTDEEYLAAKLIIQKLYLHINDNRLHEKKYSSLLKELYQESLVAIDDFPSNRNVNSLFLVKDYYKRQLSNHSGKEKSSHQNIYVSLSSLINKLGGFQNTFPSDAEKSEFITKLSDVIKNINERLFKDLSPVLEFLKHFFLNYDLGVNIPSYIEKINEFMKLEKSIKEDLFRDNTLSIEGIPKLKIWLLSLQSSFFHLSSELPIFFLHDKSNPFQLIEKAIKEHEREKGSLKIENKIPKEIDIEIHPYLLGLIIYELIENKSKHSIDSSAMFLFKESENLISVSYYQNSAFKKNLDESGLITIRNIIKRYSGKCSINANAAYEFEMTFNKDLKIQHA